MRRIPGSKPLSLLGQRNKSILQRFYEARRLEDEKFPISREAMKFMSKFDEDARYYDEWFSRMKRGEPLVLQQCAKFFNRNGIKCSEKNICLTRSILEGIVQAYHVLKIHKDDTILIPTPTFGQYFMHLEALGMKYQTVQTKKENGFLIDPVVLEKAIIETDSKLILLCYPNNPTGVLMTKKCAESVAEVLVKHDVFAVCDEAFINNSLVQEKNFSIASANGMAERSLVFTSIAKSMKVPFRTAFCVGPEDIIEEFSRSPHYEVPQIFKIGDVIKELPLTTSKPFDIRHQMTIAAALEDNQEMRDYHQSNREESFRRIEIIKRKINELNEKFCEVFGEKREGDQAYIKPFIPNPETGLTYILDFSGLRGKIRNGKSMLNDLDVAKWLSEDASVGTVPGILFMFEEEEMLLRIALGSSHSFEKVFDHIISVADKIENPKIKIKEVPNNNPKSVSSDQFIQTVRSRL